MSSSQDSSNVVENRPLPVKATGSLAVAAFQKGKSGSTKSKDAKSDKKRRDSTSTSTPTSSKTKVKAAREEVRSPSPAREAGKKRKRASQSAAMADAEEEDGIVDLSPPSPSSAAPSRSFIDTAVSDGFAPARFASTSRSLLSSPSSTQPEPPLVLFQFPAKFDVAAFYALDSLSLPRAQSGVMGLGGGGKGVGGTGKGSGSSEAVSHFELHGERYRLVEGDTSELSDLVNLFPQSTARGLLVPGRPFARLFRVVSDVTQSEDAGMSQLWPHTAGALLRKTPKEPKKGLRPHFRPVGFIRDFGGPPTRPSTSTPPLPLDPPHPSALSSLPPSSVSDHLVGSRRGRHFRPFETVEQGKVSAAKAGSVQGRSPSLSATTPPSSASEASERKREKKRQRREEEQRRNASGRLEPSHTVAAVAQSDEDAEAGRRKAAKALKKEQRRREREEEG